MKTSELLGNDLDWAVAKCEGIDVYEQIGYGDGGCLYTTLPSGEEMSFAPSIYWERGGPIIEQWMIDCNTYRNGWRAARHVSTAPTYGYGPTILIAAMRCYVASKMGEEINIPSEVSSI